MNLEVISIWLIVDVETTGHMRSPRERMRTKMQSLDLPLRCLNISRLVEKENRPARPRKSIHQERKKN